MAALGGIGHGSLPVKSDRGTSFFANVHPLLKVNGYTVRGVLCRGDMESDAKRCDCFKGCGISNPETPRSAGLVTLSAVVISFQGLKAD